MNKVLKKYTTLPPELYVTRNADKQLRRIIEEMQRPGYVLVARQMGKTNLLLNAKRTMENEKRLFAYIDLSNLFRYERDCYRNIIDNIIDPNGTLFEAIMPSIKDIRKQEIPSHIEYLKSLRIILEEFGGDLVIILDEIDAIKSIDYSDNIFSQIRSNYFSRTNYPEFERLTYILSGVIDPIELIKDKNKSPFNIGEKIYLDDFTKVEHDVFIQKSGMKLDSAVSDEIYSWTNGNPRLTFDICSEVESYLQESTDITIEGLRNLIQSMYLTTFDISPVDHIRELVRNDKKVRNAVMNIQNGKANNISDEMKKKLYLYGIINSKFDEATVIKNRITQLSLAIDWIKSIDKQSQDSYNYGLQKFDELDYEEAISALLEYINNSDATRAKAEVSFYYIAYAYYQLGDLKKAIEYFSKEFTLELKRNAKSFLGVCKIGIGDFEEGTKILEEVIEPKISDYAYRNALLNLATCITSQNKSRALELYHELLGSTFNANTNSSEGPYIDPSQNNLNKIRTLANYYIAIIYFDDKEIEKCVDYITDALEYANLSDSLYLKFLKYTITGLLNDVVKSEIVDTIINNRLKFDNSNYPINFCEKHLLYYLDLSFSDESPELFEKLLYYAEKEIYEGKHDRFQIMYEMSRDSFQKEKILIHILRFEEKISLDLLLNIYRDLCALNSNSSTNFLKYFYRYKSLFEQTKIVKNIDIELFAIGAKYYSENGRFYEGIELCERILSRIHSSNDVGLKLDSVIIYYWLSLLNLNIKNKESAILFADKTIQMINESGNDSNSMINEKGLELISEQMTNLKKTFINKIQRVNILKYGRNDKVKVEYMDGRVVESKYKKLEDDIISQRCKVIPN